MNQMIECRRVPAAYSLQLSAGGLSRGQLGVVGASAYAGGYAAGQRVIEEQATLCATYRQKLA